MDKLEILEDLAAVFRWTAKLNMHEAIANHFSVCVPGSNEDLRKWYWYALQQYKSK